MKIAYLTSFFPPDRFAGAEFGTEFMAKHMAKQGHEVHVLISRPKQNITRREIRSGFSIHWNAYHDIPALRFFSEVKTGLKKVKELKPDIIHANCLLPGGYIAAKASHELNIPSIVLCYGYDVCDIRWPMKLMGQYALKNCRKVLSATNYCSGMIKKLEPSVNPEIFYAGYDDFAFPLQEYRAPNNSHTQLLFMGRMIPQKGFELIIEIMQKLPGSFHLNVIGDGELRKQYEDRVTELKLNQRIKFLGQIPNHEIQSIFRDTDTLVLPSRREPFGVVCIEAIASGLPVVCSKVMGLPEAVAHERNGLVIEGRNVDDWCRAIEKVTQDGDLKKGIYENAKIDRVKWAWSTRLGELEGIYSNLQ